MSHGPRPAAAGWRLSRWFWFWRLPRSDTRWVTGKAVKKESDDLARALQAAVNSPTDNGDLGRMFAAAKLSWRTP